MSRTIGSPARMTRSDASWCGDAEFGPGADDREQRLLVALGDEPLADLARDVRLGAPDEPAAGDLRNDPVGGVGREPEQRDLVGVLRHPERPQRACRRREAALPAALAGARGGGTPRADPRRPGGALRRRLGRGRSTRRGRADRPSPPRSRSGRRSGSRRARAGSSSRGTTSRIGSSPGAMTSIVSRSSGSAS